MSDSWLEWARGPAFVCCLGFSMLGYFRHAVLAILEIRRHMRRAGDRKFPIRAVAARTLRWIFPLYKLKTQLVFSLTTIVFHIAVLIVPLFLVGHIALWARGVHLSWPGIPNEVADVLTVIAVFAAVAVVLQRATSETARALSRFQDYVIPLIVALPFATGFFVMHPSLSPFPFDEIFFFHIMSANLLLVLMPLTKLSHAVLMPTVQAVTEVGWHWSLHSGSRVAAALGKEGEPV